MKTPARTSRSCRHHRHMPHILILVSLSVSKCSLGLWWVQPSDTTLSPLKQRRGLQVFYRTHKPVGSLRTDRTRPTAPENSGPEDEPSRHGPPNPSTSPFRIKSQPISNPSNRSAKYHISDIVPYRWRSFERTHGGSLRRSRCERLVTPD